jgi:uncharacterized repeat protein (TIGR03803 family)
MTNSKSLFTLGLALSCAAVTFGLTVCPQGGTDGISPSGTLALDASGSLYGTTSGGGEIQNAGIVFKIDSSGDETVLHRFNLLDQGTNPRAGVILGADGNLYGTTTYGGQRGGGVVFKLVL